MPLPAPSITNDLADVATSPMTVREISLPAKLRHKQMSIEERNDDRRRWSKKRQRRRSSSTSSSSSDERSKREKESYRRYKRKKLLKKWRQKKYQHIDSASESSEVWFVFYLRVWNRLVFTPSFIFFPHPSTCTVV